MTYQIDISRGKNVSTVSAQWAGRPDDQRFTSLTALRDQVAAWAEASTEQTADVTTLRVEARGHELALRGSETGLTNHAFTQLARIARAPTHYLTDLPADLAAINLNYGLATSGAGDRMLYVMDPDAKGRIRAVTSPRYGRILDRDVVDTVMKVAGNGTGDTRWKVPGTIDWSSSHGISYNPEVDITTQNTTLYASDRDVFLFLVDDRNPIEVGKLASGEPDLMFRGFYVWNSEVGDKTFGVATMYLRGVCQNRNLWGVEGFSETTFRHTSGAPERFVTEAAPALLTFAEANTTALMDGVARAKAAKVATDDETRVEFLAKLGFSAKASVGIVDTGLAEEGRKPETLWDFAQAISAAARTQPYQDARIRIEAAAGKVLAMAD